MPVTVQSSRWRVRPLVVSSVNRPLAVSTDEERIARAQFVKQRAQLAPRAPAR